MFNVRCRTGEGIRVGDAFVVVDMNRLRRNDSVVLRIDAPGDIQIDILKKDNKYIPEKILKALTP